MDKPLWQPSADRMAATNLHAFQRYLTNQFDDAPVDYDGLHRFSIDRMEDFWTAVWDFSGIIAKNRGDSALINPEKMPGARFFPDAILNFSENLLRRRDDGTAVIFRSEDKIERSLTWKQLYDEVSRVARALEQLGLKPGDRCAGFMPNAPEAVIAMLGATATGGVSVRSTTWLVRENSQACVLARHQAPALPEMFALRPL